MVFRVMVTAVFTGSLPSFFLALGRSDILQNFSLSHHLVWDYWLDLHGTFEPMNACGEDCETPVCSSLYWDSLV
jgi:hypothetical protein